MKKALILVACLFMCTIFLAGCGKQKIRVVIGSTSVTGDTFQNADLITRAISEELNADIKVDPVGSGEVFKELAKGKKDGSTIAFFHDYTYLGNLYGSYNENWLDKFEVGPAVSINSGTCLAVMENNKFGITDWDSLVEAAKTEKIVIGIQDGSVSNFISEGMKNYLVNSEGVPAENIVFNPLGGMSSQREALWAGTIDVFNGSYSTDFESTREAGNTDEKTMMKIIALTGKEQLKGVDIPTLGDLTDGKLYFDKEFFFITQKGTDEKFMKELEEAVKNALENNKEYIESLSKNYFKSNFKTFEESGSYFKDKMESARSIIESNK